MEKIMKCKQCGREKRLIGQGLCCACYQRERRKRLEADSAGSGPHGEEFTVTVDFSPMAFLLEEMKKRAGVELRDVGRQILWELNKTMGPGTC